MSEQHVPAAPRSSQPVYESPLPPDVQRDLRLDALMDELTELEALEHFAELRRDAEERAW